MTGSGKFPLALLLALSLLLSGLPIVASTAAPDRRPAFTLDICSPVQNLSRTSVQSTPPPLPSIGFHCDLQFLGIADICVAPLKPRPADPPNAPPPEHRSL